MKGRTVQYNAERRIVKRGWGVCAALLHPTRPTRAASQDQKVGFRNYSRNDAKPAGLSEATTLEPWQRGPLCPCRTGGCSRCVPNTFGPLGPPAHCRLSHDNRADLWTKLQWGSHVHTHTWFPPQSYWTRKFKYYVFTQNF